MKRVRCIQARFAISHFLEMQLARNALLVCMLYMQVGAAGKQRRPRATHTKI